MTTTFAQQNIGSQKYRVVAVKNSPDGLQSVSNVIEVFTQFKVDLPTAFTPNNDGLNDTFGGIVNSVYEYKLLIYNRNGELIFKSNSSDVKWDGTHNGLKVQSGSYVYQVYAKGPEDSEVNKTGKVMVII
jgi:gliding motility-associated-like protein